MSSFIEKTKNLEELSRGRWLSVAGSPPDALRKAKGRGSFPGLSLTIFADKTLDFSCRCGTICGTFGFECLQHLWFQIKREADVVFSEIFYLGFKLTFWHDVPPPWRQGLRGQQQGWRSPRRMRLHHFLTHIQCLKKIENIQEHGAIIFSCA